MAAARRLGPPGSIRPRDDGHADGLLAATGLRVSEALGLKLGDVTSDGLVIRETSSARAASCRCTPRCGRRSTATCGDAGRCREWATRSFVGDSGRRPAYVTLYALFLRLGRETGLRGLPGEKGPRLHDLRHTFAVRSLEACGGDRRAISRHMLALATYLGHADPSHTWWYLQATPVLMQHIAEAGEALHEGGAA